MGPAAGRQHRGVVLRQFLEIRSGRKQEHAAVPQVIAAGDELGGARRVRLFDECGNRTHRAASRRLADVTVAGLGLRRHDAEGHEPAVARGGQRGFDGPPECADIRKHVIGRQHQ